MKTITILMFFSLVYYNCYSQTERQKALAVNYFKYSGGNILNAFAHPTCSVYSASVETYSDHTYYVKIYYLYGSQNERSFACEYRIKLNSSGTILSLEKYSCGSPSVGCFGACNFFRELATTTTTEDKDRFEKYLHKSLNEFSCEDYCLARLFYKWIDLGYFKEY